MVGDFTIWFDLFYQSVYVMRQLNLVDYFEGISPEDVTVHADFTYEEKTDPSPWPLFYPFSRFDLKDMQSSLISNRISQLPSD